MGLVPGRLDDGDQWLLRRRRGKLHNRLRVLRRPQHHRKACVLDSHLMRHVRGHVHLALRVRELLENITSERQLSRCRNGLQRHLLVRQHLTGLLQVLNARPLRLIVLRWLHQRAKHLLLEQTELQFLPCDSLRNPLSTVERQFCVGNLVDVFLREPLSSGAHALFRRGIYTSLRGRLPLPKK